MLKKGFRHWNCSTKRPCLNGVLDLSDLNLDEIIFFVEPNAKETDLWEEVPEEIRKTFDRLGIPEAEKKRWAESATNTIRRWSITASWKS